MLSNQIILIISPILLLAKAARAYNLGSNKSHLLPRGLCLLTLPLLVLITVMVLKSERSLLYSLLASFFGTVRLLAILDHHKMGQMIVIIIFLTILLMTQLKKAIIIKTARILQIKVRPRTTVMEVMIATIQIIITLGMVTAVVIIKIIRPAGIQSDKNYQPLLMVN